MGPFYTSNSAWKQRSNHVAICTTGRFVGLAALGALVVLGLFVCIVTVLEQLVRPAGYGPRDAALLLNLFTSPGRGPGE